VDGCDVGALPGAIRAAELVTEVPRAIGVRVPLETGTLVA